MIMKSNIVQFQWVQQHSALRGGVISRFHKRGSRMHLGDPFGSLKDRSTNITPHFGILGLPGPQTGWKWAKFGQKQGKARFWMSDGPKWLDQCGSKVDLVLGHPNWPIWSNFGIQGTPNFGPGGPETAQIGPKTGKSQVLGVWRPEMAGSVWIQGGSSPRTSQLTKLNQFWNSIDQFERFFWFRRYTS